jgi:hypothetical protein
LEHDKKIAQFAKFEIGNLLIDGLFRKTQMGNRSSTLMNANQEIHKEPTLQTGHLIGDIKFSGRNPAWSALAPMSED